MAEQIQMPDQTPVAPAAPDPAITLLIGLAVGYGYYWFATRDGAPEGDESDEEDELEEDEVERPRRVSRMSRFRDATTDALIDRPAILAQSGRPDDCYKAVKLLPKSAMLAQTGAEKKIFRRVLKAVADDCRGEAEDAVDDAMEELEDVREQIEDALDVDTSAVDSDPERIIQARRTAQAAVKRGELTRTRKKRQPRAEEIDILDRVAHSRGATARGGRPRGASFRVKRPGGESFRLRKEKAPTKRGYKWRKES